MRRDRMAGDFAFESTLGKIARVLMGQYGVVVAFSPHGPRVEPGRIVIPEYQVTDDAPTDLLDWLSRPAGGTIEVLRCRRTGPRYVGCRKTTRSGHRRSPGVHAVDRRSIPGRARSSRGCANIRPTRPRAAGTKLALARPACLAHRARAVERTPAPDGTEPIARCSLARIR